MRSFARGAEQQRAFEEIKNIWQDHPCWFLPSGTGRSTFICQWAIPPSPQWWYKCMTARKKLCFTSAGECWIRRPGTTRWRSYISVCSSPALQHILLFVEIIVICKSDIIKHMLSAPMLKGRLRKWMFALSEFDIRYQPTEAVKG
jgi:hypothetical protein